MKTKFALLTIFLILFLTLISSKCSEDNFKEIQNLLERADLVLFLPEKFNYVPVVKNEQVYYNFAYRLENEIEVRYLIQPLDSALLDYNAFLERKASGKKKNDSIKEEYFVDPNNYHKSYFMAILFNICKKDDSSMAGAKRSITEFPLIGVKKQFNADYGITAFCNIDPEFGQNYKVCSVFMIHKKDYGDVYCFRMFKNDEHVKNLFENGKINMDFYNLQFFKPSPQIKNYQNGKSRIVKYH
ncbi:MAG: hypothetical protein RO257_13335 [Candidatus Kapabacteria bacterium]|nr:hypothetical protein [Candidatus Kapabacteria bacterium]